MLGRSLTAALDVAFPPTCVACGAGTANRAGKDFCQGCEADLVLFDQAVCPRCSTPLASGDATEVTDCPSCRHERWAFDTVVALGPYEGLLRRLVLESKRRSGQPAAEAFGRLLGGTAREPLPADALVVPIPQHWTRRLARRADGVDAMAQALATARGLPLRRALRRTRATRRQTEIAPSDRTANVRGALAARRTARIEGRSILLVDDVFTTGATCQAAARALKRAGAARVVAVVAAKRLGSV